MSVCLSVCLSVCGQNFARRRRVSKNPLRSFSQGCPCKLSVCCGVAFKKPALLFFSHVSCSSTLRTGTVQVHIKCTYLPPPPL